MEIPGSLEVKYLALTQESRVRFPVGENFPFSRIVPYDYSLTDALRENSQRPCEQQTLLCWVRSSLKHTRAVFGVVKLFSSYRELVQQ